jgi:exosortase
MTTRNQVLAFAFLCAVSILFWWRPLVSALDLALANEAYTHILLILPLSVSLIYLDRDALRTVAEGRISVGSAVLVGAGVLACFARWGHTNILQGGELSLSMFALVTWWIGSVMLCFGVEVFRSFMFPLCFLFLIVPIPEFALSWIVEFLQQQSAIAARILFWAVGVPVTGDGIMLSIPGLDIEVARECSSIRSSMMLVVTTMVLAHLFLRSWWRKTLLIVATIPLSVAKNGLRIFTITMLGTRVDPRFLDGKLHHNGGIIFLGVAIVAEVALLWILRRTEFGIRLEHSPTADSTG